MEKSCEKKEPELCVQYIELKKKTTKNNEERCSIKDDNGKDNKFSMLNGFTSSLPDITVVGEAIGGDHTGEIVLVKKYKNQNKTQLK